MCSQYVVKVDTLVSKCFKIERSKIVDFENVVHVLFYKQRTTKTKRILKPSHLIKTLEKSLRPNKKSQNIFVHKNIFAPSKIWLHLFRIVSEYEPAILGKKTCINVLFLTKSCIVIKGNLLRRNCFQFFSFSPLRFRLLLEGRNRRIITTSIFVGVKFINEIVLRWYWDLSEWQ